MERYTATKTRSGRPGWSVTFRHPLRRDSRGKSGLKIRRGLNTAVDGEADELVAQVNALLTDRSWWSPDRRADAEREFHPIVVSSFFDGIDAVRADSALLRDSKIPLPSREEGYVRVLLAGTTGAGKTTLLRHLIGSAHEQDRFPSTSTAKTTISDTEIVTADGDYAAAVTFMSEFEVRAHIDECIEAACLAHVEGQPLAKVASSLLSHREQRFRLSYVLGEWQNDAVDDFDDVSFDEPARAGLSVSERDVLSDDEKNSNSLRIAEFVSRIQALSDDVRHANESDLGTLSMQSSADDRTAWLELYGDRLFDSDEFGRISLDIRDDIEARFENLKVGSLVRSAGGWPVVWSFQSADRDEFLRQIRWFSSNHHEQFGKLLTPLVDGIRVRGPFWPRKPELQVCHKLVLIDGQGLGHTADSVASVSTRVTKRFADVDVILLVDSAKQPMQAAPIALLRAAGSAGHGGKLALAFTNFDQVKGDNLGSGAQKREHVKASIPNAVASLRQTLGATVANALERRLEDAVFMFGALDRELEQIPKQIIAEIGKLLSLFKAAAEPNREIEVAPIYTPRGLELALRDAVEGFLRPWEARLGLAFRSEVTPEHWTRVKALTRRFANAWADEYDNLRPASDMIGRFQEEISRWLESPAGWTRIPNDDNERALALDHVRSGVFAALHELVTSRLSDLHRVDWGEAYNFSGKGSGSRRANEIRRIYEDSAPPISSAMNPEARAFVNAVISIVKSAVEEAGGQFDGGTIA